MASKDSTDSKGSKAGSSPIFNWGTERTDAALALQKALLESYEQASRAWLSRVQSEVTLWSDLATKLATSRSVPEALESYTKCASQRMQMAADDGRRLAEESQNITQKIARSFGNGWPTATS